MISKVLTALKKAFLGLGKLLNIIFLWLGSHLVVVFRWLGGQFFILIRFGLACVLIAMIALPLVDKLITQVDSSAFDKLFRVVPEANRDTMAEANVTVLGEEGIREAQPDAMGEERTTATFAAPRVVAYGIQIVGLLAALAGTFWAIVALTRAE